MKLPTIVAAAAALAIPLSAHATGRGRPAPNGDYCMLFPANNSTEFFHQDTGQRFGALPAPGRCKPWNGYAGGGWVGSPYLTPNIAEAGTGCTSADGTTFRLGLTVYEPNENFDGISVYYEIDTLNLPSLTGTQSRYWPDEYGSTRDVFSITGEPCPDAP